MDNLSLFFLIFGFSNHSPILDKLMVFAADPLMPISFILALVIAIKGNYKDKKSFLMAILSLPVTVLLIKSIHIFYSSQRPFMIEQISPLITHAADASFPSRHTGFMTTLAASFFLNKSKWATFFIFLSLWVGISRIYVGVHFPLDILGGIITGIISVLIIKLFLKLIYSRF